MSADDASLTAGDTSKVEDLSALWQELDDARAARGWTVERLARKVAEVSQQDCNHKTLHDRIHNARRIPWSKAYWIVKALELDTDVWRERWERAEDHHRPAAVARAELTAPAHAPEPEGDTRGHREAANQQTPPVAAPQPLQQPSQANTESATQSGRLLPTILTGLGGVIVGATVSGLIVWSTTRPQADNAGPIACALVAVSSAEVFRNPGESESLLTKREGQRITMLRDVPEIPWPDGRRYRLVRTPTPIALR